MLIGAEHKAVDDLFLRRFAAVYKSKIFHKQRLGCSVCYKVMDIAEKYHALGCFVHGKSEQRTIFKVKGLYKFMAQSLNIRLLRPDNRDICLHISHRNDTRLTAYDPCADLHKRIKLRCLFHSIGKLVSIYAHSLFKKHTCRVVVLKTTGIVNACKIDPQLRIRHRVGILLFIHKLNAFLFGKALGNFTRSSLFKYLLSCYAVPRQLFLKHNALYRVAAKGKKVVVHADSFQSEQLFKSLADKFFLIGLCSFIFYGKVLSLRSL